MHKLLFSLGIIVTGLTTGYLIRRLVLAGMLKADPGLGRARSVLQRLALLAVLPTANLGAIWVVRLANGRLAFMPLMELLAIVTAGGSALIIARMMKLGRRQQGAFFSTGMMSNLGAVGSLIVFLFLGEDGFAMVPFFRLFETFTYYSVGFPIAKTFSDTMKKESGIRQTIAARLIDPFVIMSTGSIGLGLILNLSGVPRPSFYGGLNSVLIPLASLLLLTSIGMAISFDRAGKYLKEAFALAGIKFLIVPAVVTGTAWLLGFGSFYNGLPLKVILILSSMPVGFIGMIPPSIYGLDHDLANAGWLVTTFMLALVIPLQVVIIQLI